MKNALKYLLGISIFLLNLGLSTCSQIAQAQEAILPLEIYGEHAFIQLRINNGEAKTFLFDTGATSAVIDQKVAKTLGLRADYQQNISGAGASQRYATSRGHRIYIQENLGLKGIDLILYDLSNLIKSIGKNFDGIIGYEILSKFITELDFEGGKLILHNQSSWAKMDLSEHKTIPFVFSNGLTIPQFDISFTLKNDETFQGRILYDSGAGVALNINSPFNRQHQLNSKLKNISLSSRGLGGDFRVRLGLIQSLSFQGFKFNEMMIGLAEGNRGVTSHPHFLGILGTQIIHRFHTVLDYQKRRIYLKPNQSYPNAFSFPLLAIKLEWVENQVQIAYVLPDSKAYQLGLRAGQKLLSINDYQGSDLPTWRKLLREKGKVVNILVENPEGQRKKITTQLESML